MHSKHNTELKNVELTTNKSFQDHNKPIQIVNYSYSTGEKNAILHFNKDPRYTITE